MPAGRRAGSGRAPAALTGAEAQARAAGSAPEGVDLSALGLGGFLSNLSAATLGNIIGGAVLFAGIYWLAYKRGK